MSFSDGLLCHVTVKIIFEQCVWWEITDNGNYSRLHKQQMCCVDSAGIQTVYLSVVREGVVSVVFFGGGGKEDWSLAPFWQSWGLILPYKPKISFSTANLCCLWTCEVFGSLLKPTISALWCWQSEYPWMVLCWWNKLGTRGENFLAMMALKPCTKWSVVRTLGYLAETKGLGRKLGSNLPNQNFGFTIVGQLKQSVLFPLTFHPSSLQAPHSILSCVSAQAVLCRISFRIPRPQNGDDGLCCRIMGCQTNRCRTQ